MVASEYRWLRMVNCVLEITKEKLRVIEHKTILYTFVQFLLISAVVVNPYCAC